MHKDKKSLAETNPELAKQWHPTLNEDQMIITLMAITTEPN